MVSSVPFYIRSGGSGCEGHSRAWSVRHKGCTSASDNTMWSLLHYEEVTGHTAEPPSHLLSRQVSQTVFTFQFSVNGGPSDPVQLTADPKFCMLVGTALFSLSLVFRHTRLGGADIVRFCSLNGRWDKWDVLDFEVNVE
jgi:hypothetical protein